MRTLDLHGARLEGLEDKVDQFLVSCQNSGEHTIRIMTGKGTGQVRTAVQKYLKMGGYSVKFEKQSNGKPNEGVLLVSI